jgi:hypothetical protein
VQAIGREPQRAPDGAPVHYKRHRPEQTTLYRPVQRCSSTPRFLRPSQRRGRRRPAAVRQRRVRRLPQMRHPGAWLLASALQRLRHCAHDKLVAFSRKRRGFCPASVGATPRTTPTCARIDGPRSHRVQSGCSNAAINAMQRRHSHQPSSPPAAVLAGVLAQSC